MKNITRRYYSIDKLDTMYVSYSKRSNTFLKGITLLSSKLHGSKRANSVSLGEPFESTGRRLIARASKGTNCFVSNAHL